MSQQRARALVEWVPVSTLRPDPANPRQHSKAQVKQIARSIESFGFNEPVVIDANNKGSSGKRVGESDGECGLKAYGYWVFGVS